MAENEIPQGSNNAGVVIGWIEKLGGLIKKLGLQNILTAIMLLFVVIVVGQIAFNPYSFVQRIEEMQNKAHTEAIMKRINSEPKIREALIDFRDTADADRVFVLEAHNGGTNLANLPFLYIDLTYAEPKSSLSWLENEYKNVRLSRYPFATNVFENSYWFGSIEELKEIDEELYLRLQKEDVKYIGLIVMYGKSNPSGALGVIYTDDNAPSEEMAKRILFKYSSIVSQLINND